MKQISRRDFLKASAATSGAALLTACGGSSSSTASPSTTSGPASDGPRSVSYWIDIANTSGADVKSMGDLYCWKAIEANTGIHVDFQHPASGQAAEQFNLVVAGNEMPDIMYYNWATAYSGGADAAIEDGKILPLQDYMAEYAPNMTHYFELHPDMLADITTDSGNIYGFPAIYTSTAEGSKEWQGVFDREPFSESFIGLVIRTNGLDPSGIHEIRNLVKSLPSLYDCTVLISSHMLSEIELIADDIGILNHGRLLFEGSMNDLRQYALQSGFAADNLEDVFLSMVEKDNMDRKQRAKL